MRQFAELNDVAEQSFVDAAWVYRAVAAMTDAAQRGCGERAPLSFFSRVRGALRRLLLPGNSVAENALFLALILVGAAVRLVWLGDVPFGLNQR